MIAKEKEDIAFLYKDAVKFLVNSAILSSVLHKTLVLDIPHLGEL